MEKWLWRIREEEGSTALTLSWFMLCAVLFAFALDSLFGVFIALQQLRTAGDAAALASTRAVAMVMPAAVRDEAARRVSRIVNDPDARDQIAEEIDELDRREAECEADPLCTPMTPEERSRAIRRIKANAYRDAFRRHYRGSLSPSMAEAIVDGDWRQMEAHELRDGLIPDDTDLGCFMREMVQDPGARSAILAEAERLARANGAELDRGRSRLMDASGRNHVVVRRQVVPFGAAWLFPHGNYPSMSVTASVSLKQIGSRTPVFIGSC